MTQKYPVGVETFSEIIQGGYAYVDKTEEIYRLVNSGKYYFLSRPRRFGKSLMLSTIEAYYEGRKDLFAKVWLGQVEGLDWTSRPVFRLNFVDAKPTVSGLNSILEFHLQGWEKKYDISAGNLEYGQRFRNIIEKAHELTQQKVVVLIDEYDKVLLNSLHDTLLHEELKLILKPVFAVLKSADRNIEFAMITGVSRFTKLSIFSDLNNLKDISFDRRFDTICGITEEEIRLYLAAGVESFAEDQGVDFESMMRILKDNYDGYHFSENCRDIYNPFSLINALDARRISHKWFESGTPTFLLEKIRSTDEDIKTVLSPTVTANILTNTSIADSSLISVLYQTGYLTIKKYNRDEDSFTLGIPNREVEIGMYTGLLPYYTGRDEMANDTLLLKLRRCIKSADIDGFMSMLQSYLAGIPYSLSNGKPEIYYENNLFLIFKMLGFDAQVEFVTSQGRIDIVMRTERYIYIFELKLNGSAADALKQIKERNYARQFNHADARRFCVGVNFSKETRTIESWAVDTD